MRRSRGAAGLAPLALAALAIAMAGTAQAFTLEAPRHLDPLGPVHGHVLVPITVRASCAELLYQDAQEPRVHLDLDLPEGVSADGPGFVDFDLSRCASDLGLSLEGNATYNVTLADATPPYRDFVVHVNAALGRDTASTSFELASGFELLAFAVTSPPEALARFGNTTAITVTIQARANAELTVSQALVSPSSRELNGVAIVVVQPTVVLATGQGQETVATLTLQFRPLRADWQSTELRLLVMPFREVPGQSNALVSAGEAVEIAIHVQRDRAAEASAAAPAPPLPLAVAFALLGAALRRHLRRAPGRGLD